VHSFYFKMWNLLPIIWILTSFGCLSVHITELSCPDVVESGSELVLDCDYAYLPEEEAQLDLKWYFNGSPVPVYQWVPSMKKGPQVIGDMFENSLDLKYEAHNDTFKKHRALRILKPDHRFSGTYQCKVSSFVDEDFQQKDVLVFAPPKNIHIVPSISETDPKYLNLSCNVEGVYPMPALEISWTSNSSSTTLDRMDTVVREQKDSSLDVTVSSLIPRDEITTDVVMACEVTIANTEFYVREEMQLFEYPKLTSRYTSHSNHLLVSTWLSVSISFSFILTRTS